MNYSELNDAFTQAESTIRGANQCAKRAVEFSAGRLRQLYLDAPTLRALKQELQHFNAKRGKWGPK